MCTNFLHISIIKSSLELELIRLLINDCTKCELYHYRNNGVAGNIKLPSKLVFIGEAPGREENRLGIPFIGKSGKLLRKFIHDAKLEDISSILNISKCWPGPGNPDPPIHCINICTQYLIAQLQIIKPQLIIAVGKIALSWLIQTPVNEIKSMNQYIDKIIKPSVLSIPAYVIYHPRYILSSGNKQMYWQSFKNIQKILTL